MTGLTVWLKQFWRNLLVIPYTLRAFTISLWLGGMVCMVLPIIPGDWTNEETGEVVATTELWARGIAPSAVLFGVVLFALAWLVYWGKGWVRIPLLLLGGSSSGAIMLEAVSQGCSFAPLLMINLIILGVAVYYLYFRGEVIAYFKRRNPSSLRSV